MEIDLRIVPTGELYNFLISNPVVVLDFRTKENFDNVHLVKALRVSYPL